MPERLDGLGNNPELRRKRLIVLQAIPGSADDPVYATKLRQLAEQQGLTVDSGWMTRTLRAFHHATEPLIARDTWEEGKRPRWSRTSLGDRIAAGFYPDGVP